MERIGDHRFLRRGHILKSLTFFNDAEKDPMPHMPIPLEWDEVKEFFRRRAPQLF